PEAMSEFLLGEKLQRLRRNVDQRRALRSAARPAVGCIGWLGSPAFQVRRTKVECCRDERFVKARRVNPKNFFAELKRRNVYKVAIAYGVVAWLLMQVASQIFPFFEIRSG